VDRTPTLTSTLTTNLSLTLTNTFRANTDLSEWTEEIKFEPIDPTGMERFGTSVALESNLAVIG
jgi:hypothetical protein